MLAQQFINGILLGGIYVLVAVAFSICWGFLGFLNFSIPALFTIGGFGLWMFMQQSLSWSSALILSIGLAAVVSLIVERSTYRFQRNAGPIIPLVSSLGFLILIENIMLAVYGSEGRAVERPFGNPNWYTGDVVISIPQTLGLMFAIAMVAIFSVLLSKTRYGRGIRALAENSDTATILGIRIERLVPLVFGIAGVFSAVAGVLFTVSYSQVSPFIGDQVAMKGLAAMVLGGMGSIWGAVLGGLIIGIVEVMAISLWSADFVKIAVYGVLLILLILKPNGLFGAARVYQEKF
ncbi:branched-chain amino acid ABC transporter permease [Bordetella sp. 2513F-2]